MYCRCNLAWIFPCNGVHAHVIVCAYYRASKPFCISAWFRQPSSKHDLPSSLATETVSACHAGSLSSPLFYTDRHRHSEHLAEDIRDVIMHGTFNGFGVGCGSKFSFSQSLQYSTVWACAVVFSVPSSPHYIQVVTNNQLMCTSNPCNCLLFYWTSEMFRDAVKLS